MAGRSSLGKELGSLERRRFLCISQHAQLVPHILSALQ